MNISIDNMSEEQLRSTLVNMDDIGIGGRLQDRNSFCEYVLQDRLTRKCIQQANIHKAIQYALENYSKVLIEISRESGKTTQVLGSLLYELGKNPNILVKIISASDAVAIKRVMAIKSHIETNKALKGIFPDLKPAVNQYNIKEQWGSTRLTIKRDIIDINHTVQGSGILSSGVGDRADLVIFDDPCDLRNSLLFPALRDNVIDSYENVWVPLLGNTGRQWYLATPWHKNDLTSVLKKRWENDPTACVIQFHVGQIIVIDSKGKVVSVEETDDKFLPIWEEQWNREQLIQRHSDIGSRSYDRAYRCMPMSDEDTIFNASWLEDAKNYSLDFILPYQQTMEV